MQNREQSPLCLQSGKQFTSSSLVPFYEYKKHPVDGNICIHAKSDKNICVGLLDVS